MNSILTEADTLFVYALVCSVTLSLFLTRRRLLYFIPWAATFVVQVLSFRRSALFVVLVTNVATVMLHLWLSGGGMRLMKNSLAILAALAVISLVVAEVVPQDVLQIYVLRYFGMFTEAGQDRTSLTSDSGHFEESRATIEHAYNRGSFWGYGFGDNSRINVPGATARLWVHNVYAAAWIYSGLYMFLFYVFLFLMAVYLLVNTIRQQAANGSAYTLIMSSVSIFLIMMMVSWYTNPIHMAQSLKMRTLWSMAFAFLLKTNPGNFAYLFGESGASEDER
jgi:hypothetical protein